jgi:hypothetical protein
VKVALLISGHMRYFKETIPSLKRSILDVLNPDIYIHTWDEGDRSMWNNTLGGEINNEYFDNLGINIKKFVIDKWGDYEGLFNQRIITEFPNSFAVYPRPVRVLSMFYKIQKCYELMTEDYDFIIRIRPDLIYPNIIDPNININHLYMPNSHNFPTIEITDMNFDFNIGDTLLSGIIGQSSYYTVEPGDCAGYLDQFAMGGKEVMKKYCSIYDNINEYYNNGCIFSPEIFLKYHLDKNSVTPIRSDFRIFILRNRLYH